MIERVVIISIIATILAVTVRSVSPQFALILSIATSIIIMFIIFPYLTEVISLFRDLTNIIGEDNIGYISVILKIVGIAYVAEFGAQLCVDAGESAIASKIELSAKVIIMFMASPILMALLNSIFSMLL